MRGISSSNSIKLHGRISGHLISIMIDSSSSHNFISGILVEKLILLIEAAPLFRVRLGDGHKVESSGVCLWIWQTCIF